MAGNNFGSNKTKGNLQAVNLQEVSHFEPYSKPFFISNPVSNNAFSYTERQKDARAGKKIFVTNLIEVGFDELVKKNFSQVEEGHRIVFEEFDDGILRSCKGLKHFIKTVLKFAGPDTSPFRQIPVYIFDNHNHAFYFWLKEMYGKKQQSSFKQLSLIHIDQHKDSRKPQDILSKEKLSDAYSVFQYVNTDLNVGNFLGAAEALKLFKEIFFIDSEASLLGLTKKTPDYFILDLDLDFFSVEMEYIDKKIKIDALKQIIPQAQAITVATSPFFIDFERALEALKELFKL